VGWAVNRSYRYGDDVRVAFGTDESNELSEQLKADVLARGHQLLDLVDPGPWPTVGASVARAVSSGDAERGVICCWTGTGVAMAANRIRGVRAALCVDAETARGARRWNDANVLAISLRLISAPVAAELLDAFFGTDPDPEELATIATLDGTAP
jgi:ribose 5-phosphate isomerase B